MVPRGHRRAAGIALLLALLLASAPIAYAQERLAIQEVDSSAYPELTLSVALPTALVEALGADTPDFKVTENGEPIQDVRSQALGSAGRDPIGVVLLVDTSGSMQGPPLAAARLAGRGFLEAMGSNDRVAIVAFSSAPSVAAGFSSDKAALEASLDRLVAAGETTLYDGLVKAASIAGQSGLEDNYVVVLSDGGDTQSINSLNTAATALARIRLPVYAVALESPEYDPAPLRALAERSGGRLLTAADASALEEIFQGIAEEIQNRYTLVFESARPDTVDLEIAVTASGGGLTASGEALVSNPGLGFAGALDESGTKVVGAEGPSLPSFPGRVVVTVLLTFGAVALLVLALALIFTRDPNALAQLAYYEQIQDRDALDDMRSARMGEFGSRIKEAVDSVAEQQGFTALVRSRLDRAGMPLRPNEYMYFHVLSTITIAMLAQVIVDSFLVTMIVTLAVVIVPIMMLDAAIAKRKRVFEEQLPDILNMIAGSLRAGWGVQQAIDLVVQEISEPARREFRRVQSETRLGLALEDSLRKMADRLDSEDFRWTVSAIAIQREVGGNLAEVLDIVSATIRERAELRRHVSALTAESRFSAIALVVLPFVMFVLMMLVGEEYMRPILETPIGWIVLGMGAVLLLVGTVWITRLTKVEV